MRSGVPRPRGSISQWLPGSSQGRAGSPKRLGTSCPKPGLGGRRIARMGTEKKSCAEGEGGGGAIRPGGSSPEAGLTRAAPGAAPHSTVHPASNACIHPRVIKEGIGTAPGPLEPGLPRTWDTGAWRTFPPTRREASPVLGGPRGGASRNFP